MGRGRRPGSGPHRADIHLSPATEAPRRRHGAAAAPPHPPHFPGSVLDSSWRGPLPSLPAPAQRVEGGGCAPSGPPPPPGCGVRLKACPGGGRVRLYRASKAPGGGCTRAPSCLWGRRTCPRETPQVGGGMRFPSLVPLGEAPHRLKFPEWGHPRFLSTFLQAALFREGCALGLPPTLTPESTPALEVPGGASGALQA